MEAIFKETRLLEDTVQELNGVFALPTDVPVVLRGKDPEGYQYFVEDETLPANRSQRCPAEYSRLSTSWESLLDPYVKG